MVGETNSERKQLWTIILLLKAPVIAWFVISLVAAIAKVEVSPNLFWLYLPFYVGLVAILCLPFFWKGSISYKEIIPRLFRRSEGVSILLAALPIALWIAVLVFRLSKTDHPFTTSPFWSNKDTLIHYPSLILSVFSQLAGLMAIGLIANARDYGNRVKFLLILTGISIAIPLGQYALMIYSADERTAEMINQFANLWFEPVKNVGLALVVFGLLNRGKSSVQAIAMFLLLLLLIPFIGNINDLASMGIGLFSGGAIILIVNYWQQSGRWLEWSKQGSDEYSDQSDSTAASG